MSGARACATLVILFGLCTATAASAFCRTDSCDPSRGDTCTRDESFCLKGGLPLYRASSCVSFAVQEDGSPKNQIDAAEFENVVARAFETWTSVDCGGGNRPSINAESLGTVACNQPGYNKQGANANIYMFRDSSWMAEGADYALGLTTVSYFPKTGEIYDTDVEINGSNGDITNAGPLDNAGPFDGVDLASIVTHETGHFLGLDHSQAVNGTVMSPFYGAMEDNMRVLTADDVAGICAIFPPVRSTWIASCEPRGGFSSTCDPPLPSAEGCTLKAGTSRSAMWQPTVLALAAALLLRRRARRQ